MKKNAKASLREPPRYDGCVYEPRGVVCRLPAAYGGIPQECVKCGWNPVVTQQRKWRGERAGGSIKEERRQGE